MLSPYILWYCGRKPPHAYALSITVNAYEREAKENSATPLADEGSGRFSHESVKGEYRIVGRTMGVTHSRQALGCSLGQSWRFA